ncbi:hypothetical protein EDB81DRAFT_801435 [Dactylonectria macrodidyma]|uniref:Uncharacterized protein n=1 Tax=Dactylonectria macrodidyma TaxID=307937 RepID=A0A9P9EJG1_9HYPO|nr:hypothetical protein EDB81DRAFT_801435 [Dactylonectria macrodidyma]
MYLWVNGKKGRIKCNRSHACVAILHAGLAIAGFIAYYRGPTRAGTRVIGGANVEYDERRGAEHFHPRGDGMFCHHVPQGVPEVVRDQGDSSVFAPRGGRVVGVVHVVGVVVLAERAGDDQAEEEDECVFMGRRGGGRGWKKGAEDEYGGEQF